jgi:23S rRNA pseudouridine2604 synthase
MEEIKYPVRINKYLALKNVCARREADELIVQRKVKINGKVAVLGQKVNTNDKVTVENFKKKLVYLAFNKPKGVITHSPEDGEQSIKDVANFGEDIFPLGRLDKDSSGLILLTNDGRVTDKLLNPKYEHEKEYIVRVTKSLDGLDLKKLGEGVKLEDGYVTKKARVTKLSSDRFSIVLTEGKKHQIRRMCDVLGYAIKHLERRRIMNIKLLKLQPGEYREIKGKELEDFLKALGL